MTPEEYFKKWAENCRIFINYKPIHDHDDMMQFAKDYHAEQLLIQRVSQRSELLPDANKLYKMAETIVSKQEKMFDVKSKKDIDWEMLKNDWFDWLDEEIKGNCG